MSRHRRTDIWDDFFEAMRGLFTVIHPAWSFPIDAGFVLGLPTRMHFRAHSAELEKLSWLFGIFAGVLSLAAGFAGCDTGRNERHFSRSISTLIG